MPAVVATKVMPERSQITELARVLGVSERTLYRLLARAEQECGQKEKDSQALQVLPVRKEPASAGEANVRGEDA